MKVFAAIVVPVLLWVGACELLGVPTWRAWAAVGTCALMLFLAPRFVRGGF